MTKICFACWIVLWGCCAWGSEYITKFGRETLSECSLVIQGTSLLVQHLPRGGGCVFHFHVQKIYQGKIALGKTIYLCSWTEYSYTPQEQWVVFAKALSSQNAFQIIGHFSLREKDSKHKIMILEQLGAIESIADLSQRKEAYLEYCLQGLGHTEPWIRSHAFGEWRYFLRRYLGILTFSDIERLAKICEGIPELSLRYELQKDIIFLKKKFFKSEK